MPVGVVDTYKVINSLGKRILEVGIIKKMLLAVYNKIFSWYYS